ncbi:hypothetical protein [Bacillus sp. AG4(2022)]|nr:hypothetical protein [Bacillus sp. AG4(2022)]MDT0160372.1 hypothetical protein [Bacillus sp. AG4(2022)]
MKKIVLKITLAVALVAGVAGAVSAPNAVDTAAEVKPMVDPGGGVRPPS